MAHYPVNHHLRPLYRVLAAIAGLYVLTFGIAGYAQTHGTDLFAHSDTSVLGLRTNLAFSLVSIVAGAVLVLAAVLGRNVDHKVNLVGGVAFLFAGATMMALLRTDSNLLNFSMATCIVSFVIGLVLVTAGLYGRSGSVEAAASEELYRHGGH